MYKFNTNALSFVSLNPTNNGPNTISAYYYTCHLLNDKETIVYIAYNLNQVLFYNLIIVVIFISNKIILGKLKSILNL